MKFIIILMGLLFSTNISAQSGTKPCACCSEKYSQFSFWIGDWDVFNLNDQKMGESIITSIQDSCVMVENWSSAGQTGTSYNYYDRFDSTWNQVYIDNAGNALTLKGNFIDNKMVLRSALLKGSKGNHYYNRITWEKNKNGHISQIWDMLDNRDHILQNVFHGIYKPRR